MPVTGPDGLPFISLDKDGKEHQGEVLVRSMRHKDVKKAALAFANKNAKLMNKKVLSEAQEKAGEAKTQQFITKHLAVDTRGFVDSNTNQAIPEGKGGELFVRDLVKYDWFVEQIMEFSPDRANYTEVDDDEEAEPASEGKKR